MQSPRRPGTGRAGRVQRSGRPATLGPRQPGPDGWNQPSRLPPQTAVDGPAGRWQTPEGWWKIGNSGTAGRSAPARLQPPTGEPAMIKLSALLFAATLAAAVPAAAQDRASPTRAREAAALWQHEGLEQVSVRGIDLAFARPGATLADYDRVHLAPIPVEFRRNWERQMRSGGRQRIRAGDVQRIREQLSTLVHEVVSAELERGGYTLADDPGEDVLDVQMAIVNLNITAPDLRSPGRTRVYTTSVGEMTLVAELRDSSSGELLARVIDRRVGRESMRPEFTTRADNVSEARRAAQAWAVALRTALDNARTIGAPR